MRFDPLVQHWGTPSSSRKIKIYFSKSTDNGSEIGDKNNSCIGGIHTCTVLFAYTQMYSMIHYFVLSPWHAIFEKNTCAYNIKQG